MEEGFTLPILYKGQERDFAATLITTGYTHKFHVDIDGVGIYFEPDEERNYRAILDEEAIAKQLKPNVDLVRLIGLKIEELFKK
ncbi:hypothetical protein [Desertivirga brevis]|uniref:hypothetical protein n=1 Tax=Desertivirga brevis TaxID=2810310 RepID=UPI001A970233|nr:hypothetical protein [Pedobacter sp. SYSU D00873]